MANSLLFDIHDAIRDLPGSTPARKLIIDRALKYLDRLAHEEGRDPALEEELAAGYIKVGEVQGDRTADNLGDTAGAMASYQKALEIRKRLAAANPADLSTRRRLAQAYRRIADQRIGLGQIVEASDAVHQALAISEAINRDPRHTPEDRLRLASDYESIGDLLGGDGYTASLDDDRGALDFHRKALEISSEKPEDDSSDTRLLHALEEVKIATDLTRMGELEEARRLFDKSLLVFQSMAKAGASGSSMARGDVAVIEERIGNTYLISGDSAAALDHYRRALELWRSYAARDPQNARLQLGVVDANAHAGFALTRSGKVSEGVGTLQACESVVRKALERDRENAEVRAGFALLQIWLADAYRTMGDKGNALLRVRQAVDTYRSLFNANSSDAASRINLAGSWDLVGSIQLEQGATDQAREAFQDALKLAEPSGGPNGPSEPAKYVMAEAYAGLGSVAGRSGSMTEAQTWYRKSASMWDKIAHPFPFNPNSFPTSGPTRVRTELARIDAALARH
jgi:non-specific serine/threonine protein kinase/serine/threonine-protein kinase